VSHELCERNFLFGRPARGSFKFAGSLKAFLQTARKGGSDDRILVASVLSDYAKLLGVGEKH